MSLERTPARRPIYLDHHATTPVDERVLAAMLPWFRDDFGNAASKSHVYGWRAEAALEQAREAIAACLGAEPREIVFTSGATESNNLALLGAARMRRGERPRVVVLATEHHAVLDPARALEREGSELVIVPVERDGLVELGRLESVIDDRTAIVSVMTANNEIGVIQPIAEIGAICRARGALFHSDAAQAAAYCALDVDAQSVDLLSLSAHKLYGPKGVGALFVRARRPRARIEPLVYGGGHERGLRSGTVPVPLVVGFAKALEIAVAEREHESVRLAQLRDRLRDRLLAELDGLHVHGHAGARLPNNLNLGFDGIEGEKLILALPELAVSSGAACSSARPEPSHVLAALGVSAKLARASLRFGLGRGTTPDAVEIAAEAVISAVQKLRGGVPAARKSG